MHSRCFRKGTATPRDCCDSSYAMETPRKHQDKEENKERTTTNVAISLVILVKLADYQAFIPTKLADISDYIGLHKYN